MTEETHPRNTPLNKEGGETNLNPQNCVLWMSCKSQKKNLKSLLHEDFDDLLLSQELLNSSIYVCKI